MEIALTSSIPTYSGGLGVLAGDTIRSGADLGVPMAAVTLLYRKGYFYQHLDASGRQTEEPVEWVVEDFLEEMPARAIVNIEDREVHLRAWRFDVPGLSGFKVPVFLLDTDLPENTAWDRRITDVLYGGDSYYRLCQEVVLGMGGVRMLRALGYDKLTRFHMNEGHAGLLTLELLREQAEKDGRSSVNREDVEAVRGQCIFTTHTPVPAGHDQFPMEMVTRVLAHLKSDFIDAPDIKDVVARVLNTHEDAGEMQALLRSDATLNLTYLALNMSRYINGVAKRHGEVSRLMFAGYTIDAITNGVHAATWVAPPFHKLFETHIPGWKQDNFSLRYALGIPREEIWAAHQEAKHQLIWRVNRETNAGMDVDYLTLGFARRAATYKRADLLFFDIERLRKIVAQHGPLQIIYAGKAHPHDEGGKQLIQRIFQAREALGHDIRVAYLTNYDTEVAQVMTAGVDIWLNTPQPPNEASGTSGMKAALNGVPSLSILDGWWIEGCIEGVTGWAIGANGRDPEKVAGNPEDAASLYDKLEQVIMPAFYGDQSRFIDIMRHAIALNGSFFNTQRMLQQYVLRAYFL